MDYTAGELLNDTDSYECYLWQYFVSRGQRKPTKLENLTSGSRLMALWDARHVSL